ncbi:MAG: hypothetical protein AAB420_02105 [Patescibacteria group bacterium]
MKKTLIISGLLLLILILAGIGYFWYQHRDSYIEISRTSPTPMPGGEDIRALLERVGQLIVLPTDEEPTVATVTDPDVLKGEAFFVNANKGDKVIIYVKAKRAILYDPVQHKIVEVAPFNMNPTPQ